MGDEKTGRPFSRRYALCSCKSISTEVSARSNTDAQKKTASQSTTLILRLNSRAIEKSQPKSLRGVERDEYQTADQLAPTATIHHDLQAACSLQVVPSPSDFNAPSSLH